MLARPYDPMKEAAEEQFYDNKAQMIMRIDSSLPLGAQKTFTGPTIHLETATDNSEKANTSG